MIVCPYQCWHVCVRCYYVSIPTCTYLSLHKNTSLYPLNIKTHTHAHACVYREREGERERERERERESCANIHSLQSCVTEPSAQRDIPLSRRRTARARCACVQFCQQFRVPAIAPRPQNHCCQRGEPPRQFCQLLCLPCLPLCLLKCQTSRPPPKWLCVAAVAYMRDVRREKVNWSERTVGQAEATSGTTVVAGGDNTGSSTCMDTGKSRRHAIRSPSNSCGGQGTETVPCSCRLRLQDG